MPDTRRDQNEGKSVEQELADLVGRASAGPGVLDLMRLYEGAERVYASTVPEPRIWVTSSTNAQ